MPRNARLAPGGIVYHVLNRANGRLRLFKKEQDFIAFEKVMKLAFERFPIRILDWCIMSNHWHMVLWPERDGDLTAFVRQLTMTHAQRWKHAHNAVGHGHLYQGRFKSFSIEQDDHLLTVLRYVEQNPLRARMVPKVQEWRWGSCYVRRSPRHDLGSLLSEWPVERPGSWNRLINELQSPEQQSAMKLHISRSRPFGTMQWTQKVAQALKLEPTLRNPGRQAGWRKRKDGTDGNQ